MQMPYFIRRRLRQRTIRQYGKVNKQLRDLEVVQAQLSPAMHVHYPREVAQLDAQINRLRTRSAALRETWTQEV